MIQKALLHSWLMDVTPAVYTAMNPGVAVQVQCFVQSFTLKEVRLLCTVLLSELGFPTSFRYFEAISPSRLLCIAVCSALQEVLPTLLTVVGQHVRPVAPHLFTLAERAIMQRMTELLLDHGASLALTGQDAVPVEGMPDITLLSPPVHRLVLFKARNLPPSPSLQAAACMLWASMHLAVVQLWSERVCEESRQSERPVHAEFCVTCISGQLCWNPAPYIDQRQCGNPAGHQAGVQGFAADCAPDGGTAGTAGSHQAPRNGGV